MLSESVGRWGRILIAEDHEPVRRYFAERLRQAGYLCDGVATAQEAVQALAAHAYDLLITDINLPDSENLAYLQACQRGEAAVPVIVITGYPSVETAVESVRLSVVNYLVKPVDDGLLLDSVDRAIGKGSLLRALRNIREGMHAWGAAMDRLETALRADEGPGTGAAAASRSALRAQTTHLLSQIAESLWAVLEVTGRESLGHQPVDLCPMVRCQKGIRYEEYEEAVRQTIEVLAKTKHAFKSKELGELRKTLDQMLKREAGP